MTGLLEQLRCLAPEPADRVSLLLLRLRERVLVAAADDPALRLLQPLPRTQETANVDLPLPRQLVRSPGGHRRLLQLLDRRVLEPLRELVPRLVNSSSGSA